MVIPGYSGQMTPDAAAVLTFLLITLAAIGLIAIVIYLSR